MPAKEEQFDEMDGNARHHQDRDGKASGSAAADHGVGLATAETRHCNRDDSESVPAYTPASTQLCRIRFTENLYGISMHLRTFHGYLLHHRQAVSVRRVALVRPDDGTHEYPPVVYVNGGASCTASSNAADTQYHALWPEAVILYTQASVLTEHGGEWNTPDTGHSPGETCLPRT